MDFDKFKIHFDGIDGIMFKGENPKKCIISFSSMNKGKFERWSWFQKLQNNGNQDLYIILKDDDHHYYLGTENHPKNIKHYKFFQWLLEEHNIQPSDTFMLGSSMGGYAALYYGFWLGVRGIISVNPQTTYAASRMHSLQLWERMIRETGSIWVDLDQFVCRFKCKPAVYLEHGDYPADAAAASTLVKSLEHLKIAHLRNYVGGDHGGTSLTLEKLTSFIHLAYDLSKDSSNENTK